MIAILCKEISRSEKLGAPSPPPLLIYEYLPRCLHLHHMILEKSDIHLKELELDHFTKMVASLTIKSTKTPV